MAVEWALVIKDDPTKFANVLQNLKNLALRTGQPWANAVQFHVNAPLTAFWTVSGRTPRHWDAVIEIDGVDKGQLMRIFEFIRNQRGVGNLDGVG